ncbi:hypothetical protein [Actinopolyspora saharensis]|uniref:hypothetical protein n=1 Tax=Actinopolyspora saharensis TaxID=995062 RepID=UPI003F67355B
MDNDLRDPADGKVFERAEPAESPAGRCATAEHRNDAAGSADAQPPGEPVAGSAEQPPGAATGVGPV